MAGQNNVGICPMIQVPLSDRLAQFFGLSILVMLKGPSVSCGPLPQIATEDATSSTVKGGTKASLITSLAQILCLKLNVLGCLPQHLPRTLISLAVLPWPVDGLSPTSIEWPRRHEALVLDFVVSTNSQCVLSALSCC